MKYLAFFLLSLFFLSSCSSTTKLSRATGKTKGFQDRIEEGATLISSGYNYTKERTADGRFLYKEYYPTTGQMTQRFTYADSDFKIKEGLAIERYDNGDLWKQGRFVNNQMQGEWQFYRFKDGSLSEYGSYENGIQEGTWTRVDSAGSLLSVHQYEKGERNGPFKIYQPAGVLYNEGVYQHGKLRLEKIVGEEMTDATILEMPEEKPYITGCANTDKKEQESCSNLKILTTIYQNIKYPKEARMNAVQGTAYVNFVVKKDGSVEDIAVMRGLCDEIKSECLRIINLLPSWEPGKQNGIPVNVLFTLPIKFKLE
ncbi:MAG: hypothetical protein DHS20C18_36930 [Saprospiraceae bacterium]|nr:MAG: hypothetical protein DHS20C18_36930 [Saprospiraceae bacterium]